MSSTSHSLDTLLQVSAEKRSKACIELIKQSENVFILVDEHGAVMLVSEDEDCIPVWPSNEAASLWRNQDWQHCEVKTIPLYEWHQKWTSGLVADDICVAIFPIPAEDGEVVLADEFDWMLKS